ncbi:hypothetical protein [Sporobacter termitidis]|uniref:hypothetical protein n=1 Tax=Sporobacter termitidis TaxID=44749 RepID=UPI001FA89C7E|nr:hypothetical protein [Sporobacter termitidis]
MRQTMITASTGSTNRMTSVKYEKNPAGFPAMLSLSFAQISFSQPMTRHSSHCGFADELQRAVRVKIICRISSGNDFSCPPASFSCMDTFTPLHSKPWPLR